MKKKNQHVIPFGGGWAVKAEGAAKVTIITTRQSDAITVAKDLAKNNRSALIVHGRNGKVRAKNNYANVAGTW